MRVALLLVLTAIGCHPALERPLPIGVERYTQTTQPTISGCLVGIADIYDRPRPDAGNAMQPSALLVDACLPAGKDYLVVFIGNVVKLGGDEYCVSDIEIRHDRPGRITLVKLAR